MENIYTKNVKNTIDALIKAGTNFDINQLELIYHDNLKVLMIQDSGDIMTSNKEEFKKLFQQKLENNDAPLNTWAKFNLIEADKHKAHVIVTRKVKLMQEEQELVLSIDLVFEENRWQVTREVIYIKSL